MIVEGAIFAGAWASLCYLVHRLTRAPRPPST